MKDSNNELYQDEPYLTQRKELQERCEATQVSNVFRLERMVYDDKHKAIMCVVPKVRQIPCLHVPF